MQMNVTGRHISVSEELRSYVEGKAPKLLRFYDRITAIDIIIDGHDGLHYAEMIVHSEGTAPFVGSEEDKDAHAAFDLLMDKMERQIRRFKERIRNRKHPRD